MFWRLSSGGSRPVRSTVPFCLLSLLSPLPLAVQLLYGIHSFHRGASPGVGPLVTEGLHRKVQLKTFSQAARSHEEPGHHHQADDLRVPVQQHLTLFAPARIHCDEDLVSHILGRLSQWVCRLVKATIACGNPRRLSASAGVLARIVAGVVFFLSPPLSASNVSAVWPPVIAR